MTSLLPRLRQVVFNAGDSRSQLLDIAFDVLDLRLHSLDHVPLTVLLLQRKRGLTGQPAVVLARPHPVKYVALLTRHLSFGLAAQVHEEEEVPSGVVLDPHVVVKADGLVQGEAREVADEAIGLEVRLIRLLGLPHAAECVDNDTSDDRDEDEDEQEPVSDVPEDGEYEEILPDKGLDNVARGVELSKHLLDAIVPDGEVEVSHEALEHVVAHLVIVLLAQQHHPEDHPDVHGEQPKKHGLHHLAEVESDGIDDSLGA
mmetsp:Transcript_23222/g.58673  ORF Transcript_23222/g.58673 Transcript_23222/m.58673 type:complete len:258 (-) Transcript_23222:1630-2403(-)